MAVVPWLAVAGIGTRDGEGNAVVGAKGFGSTLYEQGYFPVPVW